MNKSLIILGAILAAVGVAVYVLASQTDLLGGRTHHIIPLGGIGLAILGILMVVGGFVMGKQSTSVSNQFKCSTCGAVFNSQTALDQHTSAKHGTKA